MFSLISMNDDYFIQYQGKYFSLKNTTDCHKMQFPTVLFKKQEKKTGSMFCLCYG